MAEGPAALRVLVLEDEPADRALITEALSHDGIQVDGAFGQLADLLSALGADPRPDLVVTDLNVPDSQGLSTLAAIRSAHPTLPIVVCTGDEAAAEVASVLGSDHVVLKADIGPALSMAVEAQPAVNSQARAQRQGFAMADAALAVVADHDVLLLVNGAAQDLIGRADVVGSSFNLLFEPADRMEVAAFLTALQQADGGRIWTTARLRGCDRATDCTITGRFDASTRQAHLTITPEP